MQDRDGGVLLMATLFGLFPFLRKLYADGGYQGPPFQHGAEAGLRQVNLEIVKRSDTGKGFVVLPEALDRRTHHRLAQSLPPARQGLGVHEPQRPRLPALGIDPPDAAKALSENNMIPDGLLPTKGASLHDDDGLLPRTAQAPLDRLSPVDARVECRAQISQALDWVLDTYVQNDF